MRVELLYFDDCPSWRHAWAVLGDALARTGCRAEVRLVHIDTLPVDALLGFAGSPTLRVDGRDLEGYDGPAVMACRRYQGNAGRGWPSLEQVVAALAPSNPAPSNPTQSDPPPSDPAPSDPAPSDPAPSDPPPSDAPPSGPTPSDAPPG